jgi:hypothetical protein
MADCSPLILWFAAKVQTVRPKAKTANPPNSRIRFARADGGRLIGVSEPGKYSPARMVCQAKRIKRNASDWGRLIAVEMRQFGAHIPKSTGDVCVVREF